MQNNEQNKNNTSFFKLIKDNALLIVMITILIGLIATFLGILYAKPVYKASRSVILRTELETTNSSSDEANNAVLALMVIGQLEGHFTSTDYIDLANEKYLEENPNAKDKVVAGNIVVEYQENILIFTLSYQDADEQTAINKLKAVFDVNEKYFETHSIAYGIKLIPTDNASTDDGRFTVTVSDSLSLYIIFGVLGGFVIAIAVALIKNALDNTIRDREELEIITNSDFLGCIKKRK